MFFVCAWELRKRWAARVHASLSLPTRRRRTNVRALACGNLPRHAPTLPCLLQEAGYDESSQLLVEDVMMGRNLPDPRDIRKYDLVGVFGMIDYRKLSVRWQAARQAAPPLRAVLCCALLCPTAR